MAADESLGESEPSLEAKRNAAAAAAERRSKDFRQGGAGTDDKTKNMVIRREKDELIGKIHAIYGSLGEDAPIGLGSCDIEQLHAHLAKLKQKKDIRRKNGV
ncbi:hypothetical protein THRCLA_20454 [Thraustotheca clavata]|uniref:Uncharacterized protein n=1 Tax=Thraustotheca clavata TaxID=74557 RepID=A0A1W0A6Y3_9STRA|nr:hypothetical protein THRCLA_20454 [Thraustotheca clavata]